MKNIKRMYTDAISYIMQGETSSYWSATSWKAWVLQNKSFLYGMVVGGVAVVVGQSVHSTLRKRN
jgi:hypothetical protein